MSGLVDIVIVNWNSGPLLARALTAAAGTIEATELIGEAIVVDNASTDASLEHANFPADLPLKIVCNRTNRGFAAACNQGAAAGAAPYILFHNPDVALLPDTLKAALQFMREDVRSEIGVLGVRLIDAQGEVQSSTSKFPTPPALLCQAFGLDRLGLAPPVLAKPEDHLVTRETDQVMGAFLLIRRDVFERLGGFDERFFVYYDDVDLCLRVKQAGWRCVHFAGAAARHDGQGTTRSIKDIRLFYLLRSRLLYAGKHFDIPGNVLAWFGTLAVEPVARAAHLLLRGAPRSDFVALFRGYWVLYRELPRLERRAREPV